MEAMLKGAGRLVSPSQSCSVVGLGLGLGLGSRLGLGVALSILHDAGELRGGLLGGGVVVTVEGLAHHGDDHVEQQHDAEEHEAVGEQQALHLVRVWVRVRVRVKVS